MNGMCACAELPSSIAEPATNTTAAFFSLILTSRKSLPASRLFLADARRERKRVQYIERIKDWSFELDWNVDRLKELGMHTWNSSWIGLVLSSLVAAACIVPMKDMLAFNGVERADDVMAAEPAINSWFLGGHSMGGVSAVRYAVQKGQLEICVARGARSSRGSRS